MEITDITTTDGSTDSRDEFVDFPDVGGMELFADEVVPQFR